jgi:pyrrolysyl-tRNA synthetase-like protein
VCFDGVSCVLYILSILYILYLTPRRQVKVERMTKGWSQVQLKRLKELDAGVEVLQAMFSDNDERDRAFQARETDLVKEARNRLQQYRDVHRRPGLCRLESTLIKTLTDDGYVQVTTPVIMSRGLLSRMIPDPKHPLYQQVYWLDSKQCLRPMLAPHLYYVLKDLLRLWPKPVRIFEVGSCFRKESKGAQHNAEFTMLNLVEMGIPKDEGRLRLEQMAERIMEAAEINNYRWETENSTVYGETLDIVDGKNGIELGSAAKGPHSLDIPWKITEAWAGIGFGLERLLMIKENGGNLARFGKSLAYQDGVRLNV